MSRTTALKLLNPLLAVLFLLQLASGLMPAVFPYNVHRAAGILLALGIGLHVYLNWTWIRANVLKR
jgi:hypothetical protein